MAITKVTNRVLADNSVGVAQLAAGTVTEAKIADNAITTTKIADSNVTTAKIADNAITTTKIADSNVTTTKIADSNVTTTKIADSNVTTAKIASSAVTNTKIAFDGGAFNFRNKIINGDMRIDQRNAGTAVTANNTSRYIVDRWGGNTLGISTTQQQVVDAPPGFRHSLRITVNSKSAPSSGDLIQNTQYIEGQNLINLAYGTANAKTITVSFWVKSNRTGSFAFSLINDTGNRSYVTTYNINSANTWEYKRITIPGDTVASMNQTNERGLGVTVIDYGSGSNFSTNTLNQWINGVFLTTPGVTSLIAGNTFQFTGVQLEEGPVATPFEQRPIGLELSLCQRYYENGVAYSGIAITPNANMDHVFHVGFKATKRSSSPTITSVSFVAAAGFAGTTLAALTNITEAGFSAYLTNPTQDCGGVLTWTASNEL